MSVPLRLEAPAKLNLELRVTDRRSDGYHELASTFVLLDLADRLLLMPGCSGLRVEGGGGDLPLDASNLAWRGLEAGLGGPPELACLTLEKRIPAAAGLGGGSSDAAAAWRLGRAWRGGPDGPASADELVALARIGADVPFFAACVAAARVTGIGERIEPVSPVERHVVLLHPPFGLATAAVFAELRPDEWGRATNDLEAAAHRLRPELASLTGRMRRAGGEPRMTGSGPTLFTLTDDPERAAAIGAAMAADGLRSTVTRTRTEPTRIEAIADQEDA